MLYSDVPQTLEQYKPNQVLNYNTSCPSCRDFGFAQHALKLTLLNMTEAEELKALQMLDQMNGTTNTMVIFSKP